MRISIGQIIILILIAFFLFGDFQNFKKKLNSSFKQLKKLMKKEDRKKGI